MLLKQIFPTLLILGMSVTAFSQDKDKKDDEPAARFGFKGGLSIAHIVKTGDDSYKSSALYGFNGGVVIQLPLGKIVAIQPEVLFSQKGYRATGSGLAGDYDYRRYLNFLDIPLLLRINASKQFGIVVGPQYSYLLATQTSFRSASASYEQTVKNENDNITKNIFGGVIGFDLNLDHNVFIYTRYTIDFKNNNGDGTSSTPAYKNQVIQLGLGILL